MFWVSKKSLSANIKTTNTVTTIETEKTTPTKTKLGKVDRKS